MRIRIVLLWSLVVVLSAYSIAWMFISRAIKHEINGQIQKLKAENVVEEYYGNVEITGFPFSFNVKFLHPRLKFKQFVGDMLFDGIVTTEFNLFSSKIRFKLNGDIHARTNLSGQPFDLTLSSKDLLFKLTLSNSLIFSGIKLVTNEKIKKEPMSLVEGITFNAEDFSLMNKLNNKQLLYIEDDDLTIKLNSKNDYLKIDYSGKVSNAEFHEEFNHFSMAVRSLPCAKKALEKIDVNVRNYFDVFTPDKFGKFNHEVDLYALINKNEKNINIDKFIFNDNLHKLNLSGRFSQASKSMVNAKFAGEFSPEWYELMKLYANKLNLEQVFKSSNAKKREGSIFSIIFGSIWNFMRESFIGHGATQAAYVPQAHEMGKITSKANIVFEPTANGFNLDINKFDLQTKDFKATVQGEIHNQGHGDIYNLKAKLNNYQYIVDTASEYINRLLTSTGRVFFLFKQQLNLSPATRNKIKLFIRDLSDSPDDVSDNLSLTIINKDGGTYPNVGRYSSEEFKVVWNNFVYKILFMQLAENLDPKKLAELLKNPLSIPLGIGEGTVDTVQKIASGVLGLFGVSNQDKE